MSYDSNTSGTTWDGIWQVCKDLADGTDSRPYTRNTDGTTTLDGILNALSNLAHGGDDSPYPSNSESVTLNGILMAATDLVKGTNNVASYPDNTDSDTFDSFLVYLKDLVLGTDSSPYTDNVPGVTLSGAFAALKQWRGPSGIQAVNAIQPITISATIEVTRAGNLSALLGGITISASAGLTRLGDVSLSIGVIGLTTISSGQPTLEKPTLQVDPAFDGTVKTVPFNASGKWTLDDTLYLEVSNDDFAGILYSEPNLIDAAEDAAQALSYFVSSLPDDDYQARCWFIDENGHFSTYSDAVDFTISTYTPKLDFSDARNSMYL